MDDSSPDLWRGPSKTHFDPLISSEKTMSNTDPTGIRSGAREVKAELIKTSCYTRWPCHVCGGSTKKVAMLTEFPAGDSKRRISGDSAQIRGPPEARHRHTKYLQLLTARLPLTVRRPAVTASVPRLIRASFGLKGNLRRRRH